MFIETDSYLGVAPGLKCVLVENITIKGDLENGLITNCQYYYSLDRENITPKIYGCLKCKFGFNGDILNYNNIGYIKKCTEFNE